MVITGMKILKPRQRRGLAAAVSGAILLTAVSLMGTMGIAWSQTTLNEKQADMTTEVNNYVNKIKESIVFEYVYCSTSPCDTIDVVLTNVGDIGIDITEITISDSVSGFSKVIPITHDVILTDKSFSISINDVYFYSYPFLDVQVTTSRDNIIQTQINTS